VTSRSLLAAGTIAVVVAAGGCTTSGAPERPSSATPTPVSTVAVVPKGPAPSGARRGGTLDALASGDTDTLDPNITDYSLGYEFVRQFSRQLYTWPAIAGETTAVVPDLATGPPVVSPDGRTYTVTIRRGVQWDTSPPRQVTAADVVRGVEITCNPAQPSFALQNFESLIRGMTTFCDGFGKTRANAAAIRAYLSSHSIDGVRVGATARQVVFELTRPANDFVDMLALPSFSPRPRELLRYLPRFSSSSGPARDINQHTVSDGPYRVASYRPGRTLTFVRNPTWDASTDPVRGAYADRINIDLHYQSAGRHGQDLYRRAYQRMRRGDSTTDLAIFDFARDYEDGYSRNHLFLKRLLAHPDPNLSLNPSYGTNPFFVFNTVSPNNHGALRDPKVRQALSYALDRVRLTDAMGPVPTTPLSHVLPPGVAGSANFDPYPYDPARARQMLDAAGVHHLNLVVMFRPASRTQTAVVQTMERELKQVGVTLVSSQGVEEAYTQYLENPRTARTGVWDVALAGWIPDWAGNAAARYFRPLFDGRVRPPTSSDFGLYENPAVSRLIDAAEAADPAKAAALWHQVDVLVMNDAPFYPIAEPMIVNYHAPQAHNVVFIPAFLGPDLSNVWLSTSGATP
jgi:peptide/nickel transport system substrate-binding protein